MFLLLAMNVHNIASNLKGDRTKPNETSQSFVNLAQASPVHKPAPKEQHDDASVNTKTQAERDALQGWTPLSSQFSDEAALQNSAPPPAEEGTGSDDCLDGLNCRGKQGHSESIDEDPVVAHAESDLARDILARKSVISDEQQKLDQQKRILSTARSVLDERMKSLDDSVANLERKQAAHKEIVEAETNRLVKIYEDMPPKEAAAIFNIMDIHVLVSVASKMNTRRVSAVMGNMMPERVNMLSQFMAGLRNFHSGSGAISTNSGDQGDATWFSDRSSRWSPSSQNFPPSPSS